MGGGGGGKNNPNVELNLVPFIDLLSTLICFLLITAVWQQISSIPTNTSSTTASSDETPPPQEKKIDLSVTLLLDKLEIAEGERVNRIAHQGADPNYEYLGRVLDDLKARYPDRNDIILYSDSQAPYKQLIQLMDTLIEHKFADVGVNTN